MFCIAFSVNHLFLKALIRSLFGDKNLQRSIAEGLYGETTGKWPKKLLTTVKNPKIELATDIFGKIYEQLTKVFSRLCSKKTGKHELTGLRQLALHNLIKNFRILNHLSVLSRECIYNVY